MCLFNERVAFSKITQMNHLKEEVTRLNLRKVIRPSTNVDFMRNYEGEEFSNPSISVRGASRARGTRAFLLSVSGRGARATPSHLKKNDGNLAFMLVPIVNC